MSIPAVDLPYLTSLMPEFASTPSAVVTALNTPGLIFVGEAHFGDAGQYALALWIAHFLTMSRRRGAGPVTGEHVGQLSETYAALSTEDSLDMTTYGRQFKDLGRMLGGAAGLVIGGPGFTPEPFGNYQPTWPGRPTFPY